VFGGDAIDRGADGRRVVAALLAAKRRQPSQVVLLCGNRDLNKLRLVDELAGEPPPGAPEEVRRGGRAPLLHWILAHTMGAPRAFAYRAAELAAAGARADRDAVVESFLADLAPAGELTAYLCAGQLAYRSGATLFVHGAITGESFGRVPERDERVTDTDAWIAALNAFHVRQMTAFRARARDARGSPGWAPLVRYQAPLPGTRLHQASVVYGRPVDDASNPVLPPAGVIAALGRDGIRRVVVGHTSNGDCPGVIRGADGFELILADDSRGRIARGSQVFLDDEPRILGAVQLADGATLEVATYLQAEGASSPLGRRHRTGHLVKARLARGDYLLYRCSADYQIEHATASAEELADSRPSKDFI
jgi:hypothetical protein